MTEHQPEAPADLEAPGDALAAELAKLKSACRTLGKIVTGQHRAMEAAAIEMRQNGPHEAMQWILNSIPDQRDDEETRWDGKESAQEWFDRVEAAYRAAEAASEEKTPAAPPAPVAAALGKSLGQVLHEARCAGGEGRPRPWPPESWEDRDPRLKALDEAMASAVAAAERRRVRELADRTGAACTGDEGTSHFFSALLEERGPDSG